VSETPQAVLETWLTRGYIKGSIGVPEVREAIRAVLDKLARWERDEISSCMDFEERTKQAEAERDELRAEVEAARSGKTLFDALAHSLIRRILETPEEWVDTPGDVGLRLEATVRRALRGEKVEAALAAVLAIHREHRIYDECGHKHSEGEAGVIDLEDVGLTCEAGYLYSVCYACETDEGVCREDSDEHPYPCSTVRVAKGQS
jgi:hypothetical protein